MGTFLSLPGCLTTEHDFKMNWKTTIDTLKNDLSHPQLFCDSSNKLLITLRNSCAPLGDCSAVLQHNQIAMQPAAADREREASKSRWQYKPWPTWSVEGQSNLSKRGLNTNDSQTRTGKKHTKRRVCVSCIVDLGTTNKTNWPLFKPTTSSPTLSRNQAFHP